MGFALGSGARIGDVLFVFDGTGPYKRAANAQAVPVSVMEVERRSTRMLADSGIEFTDVPPRITPMLNVLLGAADTGVWQKRINGARQNHDGIGRAEIAPGVAARSAHNYLEPAAAQRFGDDGVGTGAIQDQAVSDGILPAWRGKNVPHAAQIAFALFANVANEQKRHLVTHAHRTQQRRDAKQGSDPGSVIGNTGAVQASSLLANVERRSRGKTVSM